MLSDNKIKSLKAKDKGYKVFDQMGLYVYVTPKGGKSFRFDYTFLGKRKTLTIGRYPVITLSIAREELINAKRLLLNNISPSKNKQSQNSNKIKMPFKEPLTIYYNQCKETLAENTLLHKTHTYKYLLKRLGNIETSKITKRDILDAIGGYEKTPTEKTKRLIIFINKTYQTIINDLSDDFVIPTANISLNVKVANKIDRYLTKKEINFVFNEMSINAPKYYDFCLFLIQTMCRINEVLNASLSEFDLEDNVWTIPKERMKNKAEFKVYLSRQSKAIVEKIIKNKNYEPQDLIFKKTFSNSIKFREEIKKIGEKLPRGFTPHDFRRTASTHLNEKGYNSDHIEALLSHKKVGIRAVYNVAEYKAQKTEILQDWADMLDEWIKG